LNIGNASWSVFAEFSEPLNVAPRTRVTATKLKDGTRLRDNGTSETATYNIFVRKETLAHATTINIDMLHVKVFISNISKHCTDIREYRILVHHIHKVQQVILTMISFMSKEVILCNRYGMLREIQRCFKSHQCFTTN